GRMIPQQIVDGEAFKIIATRRVDRDNDILLADGAQSRCNPLCCNTLARPPVFADLLEDRDRVVILLSRSTNLRVPALKDRRCDLGTEARTCGHLCSRQVADCHAACSFSSDFTPSQARSDARAVAPSSVRPS